DAIIRGGRGRSRQDGRGGRSRLNGSADDSRLTFYVVCRHRIVVAVDLDALELALEGIFRRRPNRATGLLATRTSGPSAARITGQAIEPGRGCKGNRLARRESNLKVVRHPALHAAEAERAIERRRANRPA